MAAGATTISGAYTLDDTTGIKGFIEATVTATMSGAQVWTYQDQENKGVWIGITEVPNHAV